MTELNDSYTGRRRHPIIAGSWHHRYSSSSRWDYHYHDHDCYELICIDRGHCKYTIGNYSAGAHGPTIFLLAPRLPHTFFTEGFLPDGETIGAHMLWFEPRMIEAWRGQLTEFDAIAPVLNRSRHGVQFEQRLSGRVITGMAGLGELEGIHGCTRIIDLLAELAAGRSWEISPESADGDYDSESLARVGAIDDWMHAHYREPITLGDAADALRISVSTLNLLLKTHFRCTFLQHLSRIRVDQAKHELEHSRDEITDIAFSCGFNSIPTFNRRFRQMVGRSPSDYRGSFRYSIRGREG